jgi:AbrB family looped-hinge helix DNA binding protein
MNIYAKISKKGQITIPKSIRESLRLGNNSAILFILENGEVKIKGVPGGSAESLAGSLKKFAKKYEPLDKIRVKIQEEIAHEADKDQG